jgi:NCS1 family nucleobase:cation symporter-1
LYVRGGAYEYKNGINARAMWSLACGIFVALIGLVVPSLRWLYSYAWFVGFAVSASVYIVFMKGRVDTRAE